MGEDLGIAESDFKFVWTYSSSVTQSVTETLKQTNAMIQIYHSTDTVKSENFTWLDGEFLAMKSLGKPCVRICSDRRFDLKQFSKFDKDTIPVVVNFAHGNKRVKKAYRNALKDLIKRLDGGDAPPPLNRYQ